MSEGLKKLSIRLKEDDHKKLKVILGMENKTTIGKVKTLIENYTYNQNRYKENKIKKPMINVKLAYIVTDEIKSKLSKNNYCKNSKTISKFARGLINKYLLFNPDKIDLEYLNSKMLNFYKDNGYIKRVGKYNKKSIERDSSINFKIFKFEHDKLNKQIPSLLKRTSLPKILEVLFYGYAFEEEIDLEDKYYKRVCITAKIDQKLYQKFKEDRLVKGKLISIQQAGEALIRQELMEHNELDKLLFNE